MYWDFPGRRPELCGVESLRRNYEKREPERSADTREAYSGLERSTDTRKAYSGLERGADTREAYSSLKTSTGTWKKHSSRGKCRFTWKSIEKGAWKREKNTGSAVRRGIYGHRRIS